MILIYKDKQHKFRAIGVTLRMLRKKHGYTQEQIAEKLFISRQAYCFWESERSEIPLFSFLKLADIYSMSLEELIHVFLVEDLD
ncbi:helix-turn-helix domain-containing protein [Sphingobacterium siyangense]|jgi:transcriptional regulator with XRE-family HTH domain|uniref:helix-turn-helix domain-containing protein n=1 Tax=Sphingobacterium siyangense TaxID=459529 RepID=UPI003C72E81F